MIPTSTNENLDLFQATPQHEISEENLIITNSVIDKELEDNWAKMLEIIRGNLSSQAYKTWFEPIKAIRWIDDILTIQVPSQFFQEWIEESYSTLLERSLKKVFGQEARLIYEVLIDSNPDHYDSGKLRVSGLQYSSTSSKLYNNDVEHGLKYNYSFDNFIVGDSNRLAFTAAQTVAKKPGENLNPLVIYAASGLGKTHLIQAIGNEIIKNNPRLRVLYINSEEFSNDYINAIQNSNITQFHNHYRSFDVLIMDDIQFLSGKTKTQDTFFHTFNALHQKADKQIIIALDKPIDEVQDLDERLKSRLKWGLTVNIERPDFELRHSIVKKKAQDNGIDIPEEIIEYIATNVTNNIRELEGTLNGYTARVTFEGVPHSVELAKTVISGIAKNDPKKMTIEDIKKLVSEYYKIPTTEMESKSRKHEIALSRQMSMYLAKQLTQLSLKSIGSAFGGRDHSTVLHSCTQIENYLVTDKSVKNAYEYLLKTLKSMY